MLRPGSGYYVAGLVETPNPFAVIRNPYTSDSDRSAGQQLFREQCAGCHGLDAAGEDQAPSLVNVPLRSGDSAWGMYRTIQRGIPDSAMPALPMSERQRWQLVAFLDSQRSVHRPPGASTDYRFPLTLPVSAERLRNAASEPGNWLTYSGRYSGWRHSDLDRISRTTVAGLRLTWARQFRTREWFETSPLVIDGVMYFSVPPSDVWAVDAATGAVIWTREFDIDGNVPVCCGRVNRGVTVLGERVFIGALDGRLIALDSRTGNVIWEVRVADPADGYSITAAPLAVGDKIIIGVAGGEYGIRGFLDAYEADTGTRAWRFDTIPGPGQPGHETWGGDSWRTGGGPTWVTGASDPELGLLYWGVGNPAPNFDGAARTGDNLYTDSVVALDVDTGKLAWHFQFTPHDEHDWDSNQVPVLVDAPYRGAVRKLMLWANRNGFFYVLDRETGEFLTARAFARQTWAERIDEDGRPIVRPDSMPSPAGTLTWPGPAGATNWSPPSYSPSAGLFFVPYLELPAVVFRQSPDQRVRRQSHVRFYGSAFREGPGAYQTGIRALRPLTGEIVWDYAMPPRDESTKIGGVLSTAGGLAFIGSDETFYAFDVATGTPLWSVNLGGRINAPPISYQAAGKQFVTIAAGSTLYSFSQP
jgi:alcohol dehydrogenase (cytochrome c)